MSRQIQLSVLLLAFLIFSPLAHAQLKPASKPGSKPVPAKPSITSVDVEVPLTEKPKEVIPPSLIVWKISYADALAESKRTNKPLMVDFSGANCGWCRIKEKYIDADPTIAKFVNENFIPVKGAKDIGPVKTAFKPTGTPHTLLISHDGEKLLVRISGYSRPNEFVNQLYDALQLEKGYQQTPGIIDQYNAIVALDSNDLAQGVALLDTAITDNPKIATLYCSRAWRLFALGKYDAAAKDYLKAKELAPTDPQPPFDLAKVYLATAKFPLAVKELQAARKLTPRSPFYIGIYEVVALARAGRKKESEDLLKNLHNMPRDIAYGYSYPQASISAIANNDPAKLEEYFAKLSPGERATFAWAYGNLLAVRGDKTSAITYLQKSINPKKPVIWGSMLAVIDLKALGVNPPAPAPAPAKPKPAATTPTAPATPPAPAKPSEADNETTSTS